MDTVQFDTIRKTIPKRIDLALSEQDGTLQMLLREPYQPLHSDNAAFEAWVLYVHQIATKTKVLLQIPKLSSFQYESLHFKRFLYRVSRFLGMGYKWFSVSEDLGQRTERFAEEYRTNPKIMRLPHSDTVGARSKGERILQNQFSNADSILSALPECGGARLNTEFPVDLYWGKKRVDMCPENRVFPGGTGNKLDLWCVPGDALTLFHLTYQEPLASIISELFFYANWCRDVFLESEANAVVFPRLPSKAYRGFDDFYDENGQKRKLKIINACFLADTFHPELSVDFICEMLSTRQIHFQMLKYSCDMPLKFT